MLYLIKIAMEQILAYPKYMIAIDVLLALAILQIAVSVLEAKNGIRRW